MTWLYTYRLCSFCACSTLQAAVADCSIAVSGLVFMDSKRDISMPYTLVGIFTGLYTVVLLLTSLILDSCHRPLAILCELILLAMPAIAWIVVAVMTSTQNGQNFRGSVCADPDSTANDICQYAGPIVWLSTADAAVLVVYLLVLAFVACIGARRGRPIWMYPVPRSSSTGRRVPRAQLEGNGVDFDKAVL
ncbi:hypothetical protein C2E23DRAFT_868427 [Lenzites betulinus]|nr:hypothetical protein C2E23DRAFT_868427 [Lenzites betulinus]